MAEIMAEILPRASSTSWPATATLAGRSSRTTSLDGLGHRLGTRRHRGGALGRPTLKKVHLELGGKAPVIVFDDADVESTRPVSPVRILQRRPGLHGGHTRACRPKVHADSSTLWSSRPGPRRSAAPMSKTPTSAPQQREPAGRVSGFFDRVRPRARPRGGSRWRARLPLRAHRGGRLRQDDEMVQSEIFGPVLTSSSSATRQRRGMANGSSTASPRACGLDTSGPCASPVISTSAACGSTRTSRSSPRCPRRLQALGLRQGPLRLRLRGLHPHQARHEQHRTMSARTTRRTIGTRQKGHRDDD